MEELKVYVDASGDGRAAIVVQAFDRMERKIIKVNGKTHNENEYLAVMEGLKMAALLGAEKVKVLSDSMLVVNQLNGKYAIKVERLRNLAEQIKKVRELLDFTVEWVRREENLAGHLLEGKSTLERWIK
jgi:probable phosphoglycerate mutase